MTDDIQSIVEMARAIDRETISPQDGIASAHARIAARDAEIRAFVTVDDVAPAMIDGALRGIAVGVKDIIDTSTMPTQMGSLIYEGWRPKADAAVITALRTAGATIIGKTHTTPFAHSDPTPTRNPWRTTHTPGGSSSGSAAAVAAGIVPLAIGTQTGGSTIRPAAYCGVCAIRPTYGLIPTVGVKCLSWSLDTVGVFARNARDVAYALAAITKSDDLYQKGDQYDVVRIGIARQEFAGTPQDESVTALDRAIDLVGKAGSIVRDTNLSSVFADAWEAHLVVQDFEARQALAWELAHEEARLPPVLKAALRAAESIGRNEYLQAQRTAASARAELARVFLEVDVLITYSAPGAAPATLETTGDARYDRLWSLMGGPCINVPGLVSADGMPVGVQVIGACGEDGKALAAAHFVERAICQQPCWAEA